MNRYFRVPHSNLRTWRQSGFPGFAPVFPAYSDFPLQQKKAQHYANILFAFSQQYAKRRAIISSLNVTLKFPNVVIQKAQ